MSDTLLSKRDDTKIEYMDEFDPTLPNMKCDDCFCERSKCLKMYCQCFAEGKYCKNCKCQNCQNQPGMKVNLSAGPMKIKY